MNELCMWMLMYAEKNDKWSVNAFGSHMSDQIYCRMLCLEISYMSDSDMSEDAYLDYN